MRYVFMVLMCLMILFVGVQYNDPDGVLWMSIYAVPAFWCALATFAARTFERVLVRTALIASIVASMAGVVWFWPLTPGFWTKDVWYNVETAREGLGLMIVSGILLLVIMTHRRRTHTIETPL